MDNAWKKYRSSPLAVGDLGIQLQFLSQSGKLRQGESLLCRRRAVNNCVDINCSWNKTRNTSKSQGTATECDLWIVQHKPECLLCAGYILGCRTRDATTFDFCKKGLQSLETTDSRVHPRQLSDCSVR